MSLVSSKNVETNRVELVIEVKGEEFAAAVENAFRKNIKKTLSEFRIILFLFPVLFRKKNLS